MSRRRAATIITIAAIAVSLIFLSVVSAINFSLRKNAAERSIRYPLVIGPAESSGIQIVMNSIFHIDKPSGLISFTVYEKIVKDKRTLNAYPLAVADSIEGTPIIGTNEEYIQSFHVLPAEGTIDLSLPENAVLGSEAAVRTGLHVGDKFRGSIGPANSTVTRSPCTWRTVPRVTPRRAELCPGTSSRSLWPSSHPCEKPRENDISSSSSSSGDSRTRRPAMASSIARR